MSLLSCGLLPTTAADLAAPIVHTPLGVGATSSMKSRAGVDLSSGEGGGVAHDPAGAAGSLVSQLVPAVSTSPSSSAASGDRAHLTAPGGSASHTLGPVTGEGEGDQPSPESAEDCPTCHGWGRRRISASNSTTCEVCGGSGVWEGGAL